MRAHEQSGPSPTGGLRARRTAPLLGRLCRLVCVLVGVLAATLFIGAGVASAHDVLTGSNPAAGATVETMPATVTLTFDQPVQNLDAVLVVTGPNGNLFTNGPAAVDGNNVTAPLGPAGPAGQYRVAYRIVSADGHPVTGQISFTLAAAGAGTAAGSPPAAGSAPNGGSGSGSSGSGGLGGWIWLGLGIAAVLVVIAVGIALRRPRELQD